MTVTLREIMQQHWEALDSHGAAVSGLRVADLPVETSVGPVIAAVDRAGDRHILVPIETHRRVRGGLDGPALLLKKTPLEDDAGRRTFADLRCARPDLNDVFTGLCADVLASIESQPADALKALYRQLDRWRALFQTTSNVLGVEQQAGLFGELLFLDMLLGRDAGAHLLWKGPLGHRHDFASAQHAVEIKSSLATDGRRARIHGLDQLDAPAGGLHLYWIRLETGGTDARSLNDLARQVVDRCEDESAVRSSLSAAGYRFVDAAQYEKTRFVVLEERCYAVNEGFPRLVASELTAAGVAIDVTDVAYTIDLSSEHPAPLDDEATEKHVEDLLLEGAG
ncbi:PD-(D/E)XK motif protein [Kribbella sp. NPDC059898]|uniref:PD-(D/E)XK motif protein n=1 Tax=Kribbella sp. NPDC059898 TaxID=3346995 RepID=UPI0036523135